MNLIEAIQSGKRFKRPDWATHKDGFHNTVVTWGDMRATDYELEPGKPMRVKVVVEEIL